VQRWFTTLQRPALADRLRTDLRDQDLDDLTGNPLLLTALCVIYLDGRKLPEDTYTLYQRICTNVLHKRYEADSTEWERVRGRIEVIAHGMHTGDGLGQRRETPEATATRDEIERLLCAYANLTGEHEPARVEPARWRDDLLARSGLLLPRPDDGGAFYHLSIQEFLAAERIHHRGLPTTPWSRSSVAAGTDRRGTSPGCSCSPPRASTAAAPTAPAGSWRR
jgi:hypothetical protein